MESGAAVDGHIATDDIGGSDGQRATIDCSVARVGIPGRECQRASAILGQPCGASEDGGDGVVSVIRRDGGGGAAEGDGATGECDVSRGGAEGDRIRIHRAGDGDRACGEPGRGGAEIQGVRGGGVRGSRHHIRSRRGCTPALSGIVGRRGRPGALRRAKAGGGIIGVPIELGLRVG